MNECGGMCSSSNNNNKLFDKKWYTDHKAMSMYKWCLTPLQVILRYKLWAFKYFILI